jgi:hypothetical protein
VWNLISRGALTLLRNRSFLLNLPVIIPLIILSSTPYFILIKQQDIANEYAGYAFYLLVIAVIYKIIQSLVNKRVNRNKAISRTMENQP